MEKVRISQNKWRGTTAHHEQLTDPGNFEDATAPPIDPVELQLIVYKLPGHLQCKTSGATKSFLVNEHIWY
jgi:hypothetical protein